MSDPQGIWLGLLKWSLAHTDGTSPSSHSAMNDEDKAFLERVMREFTRNEPERMKEIILELVAFVDAAAASSSAAEANQERIEILLDELRDIIEQIDMAQVFCKFGGLQCVIAILENSSIGFECRSMSASVLATLSQNNLTVQDTFYNQGIVQRLSTLALSYLASESTKNLAAKVMHALSCSIRNHPAAEEFFSLTHGQAVLTAALPQSPPSIISSLVNMTLPNTYSTSTLACMKRAVYLANALVGSDSRSAPRLRHLLPALLPAIIQCLTLDDLDLREGTSRLLLTLLSVPAGRNALSVEYKGQLTASLEARKSIKLADDEQELHEKAMVDQIYASLAEGPVGSHYERRAADEGPDDDSEPASPRLMIGSA